MVKAAVIIANGFEEIEAITPIDTLKRAGVEVFTLGVGSKEIEGAHGIKYFCDYNISEFTEDIDTVVIPGGMPGAVNISESTSALNIINSMFKSGKLVAAICASPGVVLGKTEILDNREFTCYPGFEDRVKKGKFSEKRVVNDNNVITSRGPGSALEFSLEIVKELVSAEMADKLAKGMLVK